MLLALDISASRTGWAIFPLDAPLASLGPAPKPLCGVQGFQRLADLDGDFGIVYLRFEGWLGEMIAVHGVTHLAFEAPLVFLDRGRSNVNTARLLIGLAAHAEKVARARSIPPQNIFELDVASLKKFSTGHGRADKAMMLEAARRSWGPGITDHNVADALHLGNFAMHRLKFWDAQRGAGA